VSVVEAGELRQMSRFGENNPFLPTAHPELVEGAYFLLQNRKKKVQPFDKLRVSGRGMDFFSRWDTRNAKQVVKC
jgi:hypothetical protein